jgi:hypothetical protein
MFGGLFRIFRHLLPSGKEPLALPPADPVLELPPAPIITPPPEVPIPLAALEPSLEDRALEQIGVAIAGEPEPEHPETAELEPAELEPPQLEPAELEPPQLAFVEPEFVWEEAPEAAPVRLEASPAEPETQDAATPEPLSVQPDPKTQVQFVPKSRVAYFAPSRYAMTISSGGRALAPDLAARVVRHRPVKPAPRALIAESPQAPAIDITAVTVEPLSIFATGSGNPSPAAGVVQSIDPGLFTCLIANREGAPQVPAQATHEYIGEAVLLSRTLELRERMLSRYTEGEPALTQSELYQLSYSLIGHSSTALLLCHNVTKAFARGSRLLHWECVNRPRSEYSDGRRVYGGRNLFYSLFAPTSFGSADSGDWYRFFAQAALASFTARGETRFPAALADRSCTELARRQEKLALQIGAPESPFQKAFVWSNTFAFWEGGCFARTSARSADLIRLSRAACTFAFRVNGITTAPQHNWVVPLPGALTSQSADWDLARATLSVITADG